MASRVRFWTASAITLCVVGSLVPAGGASAAPAPRSASRGTASGTGARAGAASTSSAQTGRLHVLATPRRAVSSATGTRLPKRRVSAGKTLRIAVDGRYGLPRAGVLAVAVVITASRPAGPTDIRALPSSAPVLVSHGRATSAFAVVPVRKGRILLRVGPRATHVAVDIAGWFSSAAEKGTAGLFRPLPERTAALSVPARSTRTLTIGGQAGVPRTGARAVLARVVVAGAAAGPVTLAGSSATTSIAHRPGTTSDLALAAITSRGTVTVRNGTARTVTVQVRPRGWFTDGSRASAYGDTLHLAAPYVAAARAIVGVGGASMVTCGRGGIPAVSVARPPSLVLARTATSRAGRTTSLSADPAGATPAATPQLDARRGETGAGLLVLPPGRACRSTVSSSDPALRATVEPYAWFSGGTVLSSRLRVLAPSVISRITSLTDDQVVLAGSLVGLPPIAAGDIVSAGVTPSTPAGMLRRIVSVTTGPTGVVLATSPAAIDEVLAQGSISVGASTTAPRAVAPVPPAAAADPGIVAHVGECELSGSPVGFGLSMTCSHTFSPSAGVTVTATGSEGWALALDIDVSPGGFHLPTHAAVSMSESLAASARATATVGVGVDETVPLLSKSLEPIVVFVGEVPLVLVPLVTAELAINGQVTTSLSATGEVHGSATLGYDSSTGTFASESHGGDGRVSHRSDDQASLKVGLKGAVGVDVYGIKATNIHIGAEPFVKLEADRCTGQASFGADLSAGISVGITKGISISQDISKSFRFGSSRAAWRNCAVWSGTMTFRHSMHTRDELGRQPGDLNASENVTLQPLPGGFPPSDGMYKATGSGSGGEITRTFVCGTPGEETPIVVTRTWSGTDSAQETGRFSFAPYVQPGYTVLTAQWGGTIPGRARSVNCNGVAEETDYDRPSDFLLLADTQAGPPTDEGGRDLVVISTPEGQSSFSGSRVIDTLLAYGGTDHLEFTYALTKTCLLGGTDC